MVREHNNIIFGLAKTIILVISLPKNTVYIVYGIYTFLANPANCVHTMIVMLTEQTQSQDENVQATLTPFLYQ
jgi:hypothetical protein